MSDLPAGAAEARTLTPAPKLQSTLNGRQKAAVLLVSLGPERAAELLSHLHEEEIEALTLEMAKTRQVGAETTEAVMTEVVETTA
ncbi:MAG: flagellar motor switch protein FliG, partial [Thermoleophilaceae bacterium]|nr:flagellar motor switch protein FliG [Thermoleophilaceae bacterium]